MEISGARSSLLSDGLALRVGGDPAAVWRNRPACGARPAHAVDMEQPSQPSRRASVTRDGIKRLRADMATTLRATTGEPEPDLAHLSDEEHLIALLKAAPDGLTSRQLDAPPAGRP